MLFKILLKIMKRLLPFFLLFSNLSCRKELTTDQQIFSGVVLDYSTNTPIPNSNVSIMRGQYIGGFGGNLLGLSSNSSNTNNIGQYSLTVDRIDSFHWYYPQCSKNGYVFITPKYIAKGLTNSNNNYADTLFLDKYSILKTIINKITAPNPTDTLDLRTEFAELPNPYFTNVIAKERRFIGLTSNKIIYDTTSKKKYPNIKIEWTIKNNGIINFGEKQIVLNEFSSTTAEIDY